MKERYCLYVASSVLILVMMLSSVAPVMASYPSSVAIEVTAMALDDETRQTGIIVLGLAKPGGWPLPYQAGSDFTAHYTLAAKLAGIPTTPTYSLVQLVMMNRVNVLDPNKQFAKEYMKTVPYDKTANFIGKFRWITPGVGFLDVYYVGSVSSSQIGDYMLVIQIGIKVGKVTVWGTCEQKLCILGFSMGSIYMATQRPDLTLHCSWDDPLGPFASCEEAAWWQRRYFGIPISTG